MLIACYPATYLHPSLHPSIQFAYAHAVSASLPVLITFYNFPLPTYMYSMPGMPGMGTSNTSQHISLYPSASHVSPHGPPSGSPDNAPRFSNHLSWPPTRSAQKPQNVSPAKDSHLAFDPGRGNRGGKSEGPKPLQIILQRSTNFRI